MLVSKENQFFWVLCVMYIHQFHYLFSKIDRHFRNVLHYYHHTLLLCFLCPCQLRAGSNSSGFQLLVSSSLHNILLASFFFHIWIAIAFEPEPHPFTFEYWTRLKLHRSTFEYWVWTGTLRLPYLNAAFAPENHLLFWLEYGFCVGTSCLLSSRALNIACLQRWMGLCRICTGC